METTFMRRLVSKKKKRFAIEGYDLDLTYVTPRIIAMGFPSEGMESMYRNPASEVSEFMAKYHGDHVWVFNLCSEKSYDPALFGNRVSIYPFDDHNPPPLAMMADFCEEATKWIEQSKENVVAIHCKAGKGRTGVMISALLLWQNHWPNAQDAMSYFGQMRTHNSKGITIPSQHRFVAYFGELLVHYDSTTSSSANRSNTFDTNAALAVAELVHEYEDDDDDDDDDDEEEEAEDQIAPLIDIKGGAVRALGEQEFGNMFRESLAIGRGVADSVIKSTTVNTVPSSANQRGRAPPPLPMTLTGLRLSSLPFIHGVKKFAPHIKVTTWGADGLSVHSEPITYDSSSFLAINPLRPFKGLQLSLPLPSLPVVNEFKVEISHKPKRGKKKQLLTFWLHSAFIRVGEDVEGKITMTKSELDGLVKKDKKHKVLPAEFTLDLSFRYDLPSNMLETDKKFWQEKTDNAGDLHKPREATQIKSMPRASSWLRILPTTTTVRRGMVMIPTSSLNNSNSGGRKEEDESEEKKEEVVVKKIKERRKSLMMFDQSEDIKEAVQASEQQATTPQDNDDDVVDNVIAWARAAWAFSPSDSSELELCKGNLVAVTSWTNSDWWAGFAFKSYDDAQVTFSQPARVFPAKYVKVFATAGHTSLPDQCIALYGFQGNEAEGDVVFSAGDEITPLGTISEDWTFGKITKRNTPQDAASCTVGNFPTSYVQPAPPPSSPPPPAKPQRPFTYDTPSLSVKEHEELLIEPHLRPDNEDTELDDILAEMTVEEDMSMVDSSLSSDSTMSISTDTEDRRNLSMSSDSSTKSQDKTKAEITEKKAPKSISSVKPKTSDTTERKSLSRPSSSSSIRASSSTKTKTDSEKKTLIKTASLRASSSKTSVDTKAADTVEKKTLSRAASSSSIRSSSSSNSTTNSLKNATTEEAAVKVATPKRPTPKVRTSTSITDRKSTSTPRTSTSTPRTSTSSPRPSTSISRASTSSTSRQSTSNSKTTTSTAPAPSVKPKPKAGYVPAAAKTAQSQAKERAKGRLLKEKKEAADKLVSERAAAKLEKQKRDEAALEARRAKVAAAKSNRTAVGGKGNGRGGGGRGGGGRGGSGRGNKDTTTKEDSTVKKSSDDVSKEDVGKGGKKEGKGRGLSRKDSAGGRGRGKKSTTESTGPAAVEPTPPTPPPASPGRGKGKGKGIVGRSSASRLSESTRPSVSSPLIKMTGSGSEEDEDSEDSDIEMSMDNPLRESTMFQHIFTSRDTKIEEMKKKTEEDEEEKRRQEKAAEEKAQAENDDDIGDDDDDDDDEEDDDDDKSSSDSDSDSEPEDNTLEVLKGQLAMAKVSGDADLERELDSNIALWEAIKAGGAIGDMEDSRPVEEDSEAGSWLKSWVAKEIVEDSPTAPNQGDDEGDTPSWFARWVDGVTAEDVAVLEDNDNDSDGSLDDDFASDEEDERRSTNPDVMAKRNAKATHKDTSQTIPEHGSVNHTPTSEEGERRKIVKNMLDRAIRTFNVNSKRGVKFVIESGMVVSGDAGGMAEFLVTTKGLNKEKVGEFLGGDDVFNLAVLKAFAKLTLSTHVVGFQDAIRLFLSRFRLPGEAQKIDRILEAFANSYYQCLCDAEAQGKGAGMKWMASPSTIHILAFSTIMLNTDAHNPAMKGRDRMTKEQFIRNNREIDDGKDVPKEILEVLYEDIRSSPILTVHERDDEGNLFTHPAKEGFLEKRGADGVFQFWKKRYFILNGSLLYYFKKKDDVDPIGFVMLQDLSATVEGDHTRSSEVTNSRSSSTSDRPSWSFSMSSAPQDGPCTIKVVPTGGKSAMVKSVRYDAKRRLVQGAHRNLYLRAESLEDAREWVKAMKQNSVDTGGGVL